MISLNRVQSSNTNEIIIGHTHLNTIIDTLHYDFEFAEGEIIIIFACVIAMAMYAQCNREGNECLLLEEFIDVKYMYSTLTLDIQ